MTQSLTDYCWFCEKAITDNEEEFFSEEFNCTIHVSCLMNAIKNNVNEAKIIYQELLISKLHGI